ncbi:uncharacterized protein LOC129168566 [Dunckerocampus dactyliophorus]|uniref:uncharacterized protein LOC129168566 n=1 Tax=Dunckerocampus dactyliophorus TaxID=161453 RepID=UPI002404C484|nr:uncharacterized protein LOC129168566 [Dunckerocampus dactyliophorus]
MARDQEHDDSVRALRSATSGLHVQRVPVGDSGTVLWCDVSSGVARPLVPAHWQRKVFDAVHGLSHPGRKSSARLVCQKFVWRGLKKDVLAWSDSCVACQRAKVQCHIKMPLETFQVPDHVNIDLAGLLPESQGFTHLLTMVDRTTRWPEAVPLSSSSTSTADVAWAFIGTWVACFGTPSDLSSDRGVQFTSELWGAVAGSLGVKLHRTTAYHPQANGLCERFHRSMKASLRASLCDGDWVDRLPWVLLGLRCAPKEDLRASSTGLVYGQVWRVPADFVSEATVPWSAANQRATCWSSPAGLPRSRPHGTACPMCAFRLLCVPRNLFFSGTMRIAVPCGHLTTARIGFWSMGTNVWCWTLGAAVSLDRVKPACLNPFLPSKVAVPPRRGRPPGQRWEELTDSSVPSPSALGPPQVPSPRPATPAASPRCTRRSRVVVPPTYADFAYG